MDHTLSAHRLIDGYLDSIEKIAVDLGQIQRISDSDDQFFEDLHTQLASILQRIDEKIEIVNSNLDDLQWKQTLLQKLEYLAIRIEDVAETCELALDHGFINMIRGQLRDLIHGSTYS
ncbi:MAG: hypothetical protein OXE59_08790 [Bacteroidetes bacterium]|nr:hypothetical protein [Bacteroidota bacterium]